MKWTDDHTKLQEELASIYVDKDITVQLATVAGVDTKYIKFSDQASQNWFEIIRVAQNQGKLVPLIERALNEYPTNVVMKTFLDDLKAGKIIIEPTPQPLPRDRRRFFVGIGIGAVVILVLVAYIINSLKLNEQIQVSVSLKPYDLIKGETQDAKEFLPIEGDVYDVKDISHSAVSQILTIIQPSSNPEIDLEIIKKELHASEPLVAEIIYYQSVIQNRSRNMDFGGSIFLNLEELFQYQDFFDPNCNCISLDVRDNVGQYVPEFIQIFKNEQGYSFESDSLVSKKSTKFDVDETIILIEPIEVSGLNTKTGEQVKSQIETAMRKELSSYNFIKFSTLSLEELQKKREELGPMTPSQGKNELVQQYNIDYLISVIINRRNP